MILNMEKAVVKVLMVDIYPFRQSLFFTKNFICSF